MKTVTVTKTLRNFGEMIEAEKSGKVSSRAVEKARNWLQDGLGNYEWYDYTYELWKNALDQIGFSNAEISHSGFSSQGDGASFTCDNIDVEKLIRFMALKVRPSNRIAPIKGGDGKQEDFRPFLVKAMGGKDHLPVYRQLLTKVDDRYLPDYIDGSVIRTSSHYVHYNTCDIQFDCRINLRESLGKLLTDFELDAETLRKHLCQAVYSELEKEYDYLMSDEALIETSDTNDYLFDESGDRE